MMPVTVDGASPRIPTDVSRVVERYLDLADRALPGRIEALYLTGSVALDDYQPGRSDIDFVAVTEDALTVPALDRLEQIHKTLDVEHPTPPFSGIYVTRADFERNPVELEDVSFHLEGRFGRDNGFEANPSVWLTLRRYPVALRGSATPHVWHDPDVLRQWNLDNLNSYWRAWLSQARRLPGRGGYLLSDEAIAWCVSGVARLHFTIATGDVTSKSGACQYALATFPDRWHPIVSEALAIRNGTPKTYRSQLKRDRDALAFMEFVIDDARANAAGEGGREY